MMAVCVSIAMEAPLLSRRREIGKSTVPAVVTTKATSSLDWLNPFTWFKEKNNEQDLHQPQRLQDNESVIRERRRRPRHPAIRRRLNVGLPPLAAAASAANSRPDYIDTAPTALFSTVSPRQKPAVTQKNSCICRCDCCQCCPCDGEEFDYY